MVDDATQLIGSVELSLEKLRRKSDKQLEEIYNGKGKFSGYADLIKNIDPSLDSADKFKLFVQQYKITRDAILTSLNNICKAVEKFFPGDQVITQLRLCIGELERDSFTDAFVTHLQAIFSSGAWKYMLNEIAQSQMFRQITGKYKLDLMLEPVAGQEEKWGTDWLGCPFEVQYLDRMPGRKQVIGAEACLGILILTIGGRRQVFTLRGKLTQGGLFKFQEQITITDLKGDVSHLDIDLEFLANSFSKLKVGESMVGEWYFAIRKMREARITKLG